MKSPIHWRVPTKNLKHWKNITHQRKTEKKGKLLQLLHLSCLNLQQFQIFGKLSFYQNIRIALGWNHIEWNEIEWNRNFYIFIVSFLLWMEIYNKTVLFGTGYSLSIRVHQLFHSPGCSPVFPQMNLLISNSSKWSEIISSYQLINTSLKRNVAIKLSHFILLATFWVKGCIPDQNSIWFLFYAKMKNNNLYRLDEVTFHEDTSI